MNENTNTTGTGSNIRDDFSDTKSVRRGGPIPTAIPVGIAVPQLVASIKELRQDFTVAGYLAAYNADGRLVATYDFPTGLWIDYGTDAITDPNVGRDSSFAGSGSHRGAGRE